MSDQVQALTPIEAAQPVQLTRGDVQRLIRLGIESGRSEAMVATGGNRYMTISELKSWAEIIRQAEMIPVAKDGTPPQVLEARAIAKIMAGNSWGISPFESQSLFHFIPTSGTVVPDYKALLMRIKNSGKYDYEILELNDDICTVRGFRKTQSGMQPMSPDISFTKQEAINAGLYDEDVADGKAKYSNGNVKKKGAWEAYTKDKLLARAVNRLFKRHFADLYGSAPATKEDLEDAEAMPVQQQVQEAPEPKQLEAPKTPEDMPFSDYEAEQQWAGDREETVNRAEMEAERNDSPEIPLVEVKNAEPTGNYIPMDMPNSQMPAAIAADFEEAAKFQELIDASNDKLSQLTDVTRKRLLKGRELEQMSITELEAFYKSLC